MPTPYIDSVNKSSRYFLKARAATTANTSMYSASGKSCYFVETGALDSIPRFLSEYNRVLAALVLAASSPSANNTAAAGG